MREKTSRNYLPSNLKKQCIDLVCPFSSQIEAKTKKRYYLYDYDAQLQLHDTDDEETLRRK